MGKKKTHEQYVAEVTKINPNIEVVGIYSGDSVPILHRCKIDGLEWHPYPTNILRGSGCPQCSRIAALKKRTRSQDQYIQDVMEINPNIEVIGAYKNIDTPILHRCKVDNYEWSTTPYNILQGHGCPLCAGVVRPTTEEFIQKMNIVNPNIEIIGEYINNNTGISCRCKVDGYEWNPTPSNLLAGKGCPICGGTKKKTHHEYVEEVAKVNKNISVVDIYINATTPILHKCKIDGTQWRARPNHILEGHGCPVCNDSIGEKEVVQYLLNNNIEFIPQYTFDGCKNKKKLPFDFYLPTYNACVEYDGLQHFKPVDHFGGEEGFKQRKHNDLIKNQFCKLNNIQLIRIRYDQDVETELDNFFNNTKLIKEVS